MSELCDGQCNGTGVIPVYVRQKIDETEGLWCDSEGDEELIALWLQQEYLKPSTDGWHWVKCPTCKGTGVKNEY